MIGRYLLLPTADTPLKEHLYDMGIELGIRYQLKE